MLTLSKTWIESLSEKGFSSPIIKEITPNLTQMWFSQNNVEYVADLGPDGVTTVQKATFPPPPPGRAYVPKVKHSRGEKTPEEVKLDYDFD